MQGFQKDADVGIGYKVNLQDKAFYIQFFNEINLIQKFRKLIVFASFFKRKNLAL